MTLILKDLFDKILCFSQQNFQPSYTHQFVMELAQNQFVFDRINLFHVIRGQQVLGAHTDIILFQPEVVKTFRWTHPGARPVGNDTPSSIQCPECHRLRSTSPKFSDEPDSITLKCSKCSWKELFTVPVGFSWCPGEALTKGGERGAWLVKTEKNDDLTLGSGVVDTTGDNMEVS